MPIISDPNSVSIVFPTLEELGGEPIGAETRAKAYTDQKIGELPPTPTLTSLGGEPVGAETRAKTYTDQKINALPALPTLTSLGGEPAGAETRAKTYTDQKINALPAPPTLASLGGEPAGAETRAKAYTDQKVSEVVQRISSIETLNLVARLASLETDRSNLLIDVADLKLRTSALEAAYPTSGIHLWGNGKSKNNKVFTTAVNSAFLFNRIAYVVNAANNDSIEFDLPLKTGTYQLQIIGDKYSDRGIGDFYINNSFIGSVDFYANSYSAYNTTLPFSVANSGIQTFKVTSRKSSSSTGYLLVFAAILVAPAIITPVNAVLINCGDTQPYTATDGRVWAADNSFTGGDAWDIEATTGETFTVANTSNQRIYKFERSLDSGTFTYNINLGLPGTFTLKLLFSESVKTAAGQRIGTIKLDGSNLLTNFDIFAEAGGRRKALVKAWSGLSFANTVKFEFTNILINGIEITRSS